MSVYDVYVCERERGVASYNYLFIDITEERRKENSLLSLFPAPVTMSYQSRLLLPLWLVFKRLLTFSLVTAHCFVFLGLCQW